MTQCYGCSEFSDCTQLSKPPSNCPLERKSPRIPSGLDDYKDFGDYKSNLQEIRERKEREALQVIELISEMDDIRHKAIASMLLTMKIADIAHIMQISESHVYYLVKEMKI